MNIYIRYFDSEAVFANEKQVLEYLSSLPGFEMDDYIEREVKHFAQSSATFPKRVKVKQRSYFILIKTTASTLQEFKRIGKESKQAPAPVKRERAPRISNPDELRPGWYEVRMTFRRVVEQRATQKCRYIDTTFAARLKAMSRQDCYNRIIDHLRSRSDVDPRSQFPGVKNRNFECTFKGLR